MKKVRLFAYDKEDLVEVEVLMCPPLEALTKSYGKWDQHGCWRMNSLKEILGMIKGFQELIFETLTNCEQVSNDNWERTIATHKVFMTAFLNNDSVYLEFIE